MSDKPKKKKTLAQAMREASVPMPASARAPGGVAGPSYGGKRSGIKVPKSRDLDRIMTLERRAPLDLKSARAQAMVDLITERYSNGVPAGGRPGKQCECAQIDPRRFEGGANGCITSVLPIQAWALYEMGIVGGCVGSIVVGGGKTILDILSIYALGVKTALALIPSNLLGQFWDDYRLLAEHFRVPSVWIEGLNKGREIPGEPKLTVLPYGLLSTPKKSGYIDGLAPDAIICDEADKLADLRGSATARRVLRYYVEAEAKRKRIRFAGWTGSLSDKKISEYAHLLVMALGELAPVPLDPREVMHWGGAIDVSEQPADPGALVALFSPEDHMLGDDTKAVRRAYYRRLSETMGVITTSENTVEVSDEKGVIKGSRVEVVLRERPAPAIPPRVQHALDLARGFVRPDADLGFSPKNEELESPMEKARTVAEIASGVMNVWEFPPTNRERTKHIMHGCASCRKYNALCSGCLKVSIAHGGIPQEGKIVDDWYDARAPWNKAVRKKVIEGAPYLDSPYLCEQAAARAFGELEIPPCPPDVHPNVWAMRHPEWPEPTWHDWSDMRKRVRPLAVAKRIDPFIVNDAAKWATENKGIVWYSLVEFGKWVAEVSGLPMHGGGPNAGKLIKAEKGERSIIASIDSHGRGRNGLQFLFANQLIAQVPSSARRWEQLLGRLIRRGQRADEVITWIYLHVPELRSAVEQALQRSEYVEETLGMQQKLLNGWKTHMGDR